MKAKTNPAIKIIAGIVVVAFFGLMAISGGKETPKHELMTTLPALGTSDPEPEDTPSDTIAVLQAQTEAAINAASKATSDYQDAKVDINKLTQLIESQQETLNAFVRENTELKSENIVTTSQYDALKAEIEALKRARQEESKSIIDNPWVVASNGDERLPLGFNAGDNLVATNSAFRSSKKIFPVGYVPPSEEEKNSRGGLFKQPSDFTFSNGVIADNTSEEEIKEIPYFTIPSNTNLFEVTALSALVGRIPINGAVREPYRATYVINKENLAANGFDIPELHGMMVSGNVVGDWNLKCNKVELDSATFIFEDGTVWEEGGDPDDRRVFGDVVDEIGFPCVSGKWVSNAPAYLSQQVGLTALQAGADAYANAEIQQLATDQGIVSSIDNAGAYALGSITTNSVAEIKKWLTERQQNSFDAIVTGAGQKGIIRLNRQLLIFYSEDGNRIRHTENFNEITADLD